MRGQRFCTERLSMSTARNASLESEHLPDTVSSRCIVIEMRRKLPGEAVEPFRQRAVKAAAVPIRAALEEWAAQGAVALLREIEPTPIASLSDRQNDIAEPLLAIAQLAGDGWLQRLTRALQDRLQGRWRG